MRLAMLLDVPRQKTAVKIITDSVIDEALLCFGLSARLVAEHHIIIPSPLDLSPAVTFAIIRHEGVALVKTPIWLP